MKSVGNCYSICVVIGLYMTVFVFEFMGGPSDVVYQ